LAACTATPIVCAARQNTCVDLARVAWIGTVLACLVTVAILLVDGYDGYAEVTFAVALSAGINLV
jgi:hypothetical protein